MTPQQRIEEAQKVIESARQEQLRCRHEEFTIPILDPETVREPYGYKTVGQGSDVWMEPEGYRDVEKRRWSRECIKCGKKEYTYDQEPVIDSYKPKFR